MTEAAKQRQKVTRDFPAFFKHINSLGFSPTVCIDVGAAQGTLSIYHAFPEALHVVFEPLSDFADRLSGAMKDFRHEIHFCALMEEGGSAPLLRHTDLYGSSMMHSRSPDADNVVEVPVSTLDIEMEGKDLSGPVLLKTDCQGADLFVIKGGLKTLAQSDVVIMESSFFKFWGAHHPDAFEIITYMKAQGFVLYDLLDGLFRPHDDALGQIDMVFVKEKGPFRAKHIW